MQEIWKNIEWFKGMYQVSNTWKVRSMNYRNKNIVRELSQKTDWRYMKIDLYSEWFKCTKNVHRLVAEAFLLKIVGKDEVNHKDFNKTDNRVENLEWCTQEENRNHYIYR